MTAPRGADDDEIGQALREWSQGDCVIGKQRFIYRAGTDHTSASSAGIGEDEVAGLMVLTQTCDITRDPKDRPFVETSPLVEVDESVLHQIKRVRRPNYAFVPCLEKQRLVADLDRVMTVEKQILARWDRVAGCTTDNDRRRLAQVLARKRERFAFPDEFTEFIKPLSNRMVSKHDTGGDEGKALRNLREIRVQAEPSWEAGQIRLIFIFIPEKKQFMDDRWRPAEYLDSWLGLIPPSGRFAKVSGSVRELGNIPSDQYVDSDPLDLDHLTSREPRDTGSAPQTP